MQKIFWLHIKKSAGQSTRKALAPYYVQIDRHHNAKSFIQAAPEEWNDILNNYRTPLGEYQFRRCLFAKTYLYKSSFEDMLKFAFVREPVDRCISQFFYLWRKTNPKSMQFWRQRLELFAKALRRPGRVPNISYDFDLFLEAIAACRSSTSHQVPFGLHFQTHTAAMWDDVVDHNGTVLLDYIWRLEDLDKGLEIVRAALGGPDGPSDSKTTRINQSKQTPLAVTKQQKRKIETLFAKDFELYEAH